MKITDIVSYVGKNVHIVRVGTDEGITGYGECSAMDPYITARIVSSRFREILVGQSPFDTNRLMEDCLVGNRGYKVSGQYQSMAYSGVDIALWDIIGKSAGLPLYKLFGGKYRDAIQLYGSSMSRDLSVRDEMEKIRAGLERFGFNAVKIKVGNRMGDHRVMPDLDADEEKVRATRELIGPARKLLVDANGSYNSSQAITFAERIAKYDVFQYEEPCPYYDLEAYRRVAAKITLPINVGEQDWNLFVIRDFIAGGACQIAAADSTKCGGLTMMRKVAALCDAYGVVFAPHNTSRGLGVAAQLHLFTALPACNHYQEYSIEPPMGTSEYLLRPIIPVNGTLTASELPGIGAELDLEKLETLERV